MIKAFAPRKTTSVSESSLPVAASQKMPENFRSSTGILPALLPFWNASLLAGILVRSRRGNRRARTVSGIDEILQLFARLEKRDLFGLNLDLLSGFRVATYPPAPLPRTETAKSANLDLLPFLQRPDNAFKNRFDDGFRFPARQFRYPQNLFYEVGFRQCGLLGHRPVASLAA